MKASDRAVTIPYGTITALEITGPGEVGSGGGFAGGGFGLDGAMLGMAAAGILNAVTTRSKIVTILTLATADAEAFLLHTDDVPFGLRIRLSEVFVRRRLARPGDGESPAPFG